MRRLLLLAILALTALPAVCSEVFHIDLRADKTGPKYAVALAAQRARTPEDLGHAFVVWYKEDSSASASISYATGFYPHSEDSKKDYSLILQTSKGKVYDDSRSKRDIQLIVTISEDRYRASQKVLERWKDPGKRYGILLNDCVSFAQEVAKSIGLNPPSRAFNPYPFDYVKALTEKNTEKNSTSIQQAFKTVLASNNFGTPLFQNAGPFIPAGVREGSIVERCLYSWSDSHNFHSSQTTITWERQVTKTTWKRLDHCMKLTVSGPVDANAIAKSYIEKCVSDSINKDTNRHLLELMIAIGVDVLSEGATGFAATTLKATEYANSVRNNAMDCLTSSTQMEDYVSKALKDSFGAKLELVSNWVYWDL